ncbi:MAG: type II toxin-antitoxin system RelE/ParE family toxin [Myxococcaceae bacterium]
MRALRLRITHEAFGDLERLIEFLAKASPKSASTLARHMLDALAILEHHPRVGRKVEQGLRELVISWGETGYLALYRYAPETATLLILRIRHQREAGFRPND